MDSLGSQRQLKRFTLKLRCSCALSTWSAIPSSMSPGSNSARWPLTSSIYQASTLEQAEDALTAFAQKWDTCYPTISGLWLRHWEGLFPSLPIRLISGGWSTPPMLLSRSTALCARCSRRRAHFQMMMPYSSCFTWPSGILPEMDDAHQRLEGCSDLLCH